MTAAFEITDRFIEPANADNLVYSPLPKPMAYRQTNRYVFDFEGDAKGLEDFVRETLLDSVSQELFDDESTAVEGSAFAIDYGMKPGALDLEKEAIISYYRGLNEPVFQLNDLKIRRRVYLFSELDTEENDADLFVRDLCNAAIHNWEIITN